MDELKTVFGKNLSKNVWDTIFSDADINNDGKVFYLIIDLFLRVC